MTHAQNVRQQAIEASNAFWRGQLDRIPEIMNAYASQGFTTVEYRLPADGLKIRNVRRYFLLSALSIEPAGWTVDLIARFREHGYDAQMSHSSCEQGYLGSRLVVSIPGVRGGRVAYGGKEFSAGPQTLPVVLYAKE